MASAIATTSSGSPCASLPNTKATGPLRSAEYSSCVAVPVHREHAHPLVAEASSAAAVLYVADDRQMEDRPRATTRTVFGL